MASFDVIVKLVDQTKTSMRNIEGGLKNIEAQSQRATRAIGALGAAVVAAVGGAVTGQIVQTARNFGDLEARIRATSGSGAQTAETMAYLATTAGRLGITLDDAARAFSILRANGIDASYSSLEAWTRLAVTSGQSVETIADAVANAYQGSFGKISKATEDLITVQEEFGRYVVRAGGQVIATANSTGEAVNVIQRYTQANEAFADAFEARSRGITAALNRLQTTITGNTGWSTLGEAIANIINKFNDLLAGSGTVGKAINYLATAVNFLGDNFETIATIATVLGTIFLVGKLYQGIILAGRLILQLGSYIRSIGYFFKDLGGTVATFAGGFTALISNLVRSWRSWYTQVTGASQPIVGVFDRITRAIFVTLGTLVGNIGTIVRNLAAPFTALAAYFTGLFDPVIDRLSRAYEGLRRFFGLASSSPAAAVTPPPASSLPPPATPSTAAGTTNTGTNPTAEYIRGISEQLAQAQREAAALRPLLQRALDTGNINLAAAAFDELRQRLERLGQVIAEPAAVAIRRIALGVRRETVDAQTNIEALQEVIRRGSRDILEGRRTENGALVVSADNIQATINLYRQLEEEYAKLGRIDPATTFNRITFEVSLTSQQLRANADVLKLLNEEYARGDLSLREYTQAVRNFDERLLGVAERTALITDEIQRTTEVYGQNQQVASNIAAAFERGEISARQLAAAVRSLGEEFFGYRAIVEGAIANSQDAVRADDTRRQALEELTRRFREGAVAARVYRQAAGQLGGDTDEIERTVNAYANFRDRVFETNEAIRASVRGAATTFSREFTEAFVNARNPLQAFRNFFTNLLNDIASRIVKQNLADPLADALSRMANEVIGTNGEGRAAQIMSSGMAQTGNNMAESIQGAGSRMLEYMTTAAEGIGSVFSGMGSGLMDVFSGVFDWIKQGLGSVGGSLGSLFSGMGGAGGGGGDFFGSIFSSIGSFLGFADGGRPPVGQASLVGERGPELFVPDTGGTVVPMDQMGSGDQLVVNFNLNAIDTMTGTQFLLQNKPAIVNMIGEAYNKRGRRGPLD